MCKTFFVKLKNTFRRRRRLFWIIGNILIVIILSIIIGAFLSLSVLTEDGLTPKQISAKFFPLARTLRKISDIIYLPTYLVPSNLSTYKLVIQPEDLEFLNENLPEPYTDEILSDAYKKEVPGVLYYQNEKYNVEVRYRGQHSNHWSADKKSWLIRFLDDKLLFGKKEINLILPYDRSYGIEQLDNYRAEKLGVLAPTSQFVKLKVNNKSIGVYFEIEGWTSEMVEKKNLSSGTDIYTYDTSVAGANALEKITYWEKYIANPYHPEDYKNLEKLISITNYDSGQKFANEIGNILDLEKFYAWQINYMLMSAGHGNGVNLKLYFNKDTGKFEPISWDVGQGPAHETIDYAFNKLCQRISAWPEFIQQRNLLLWEYVKDDENLNDDLKYYDKIYNKIRFNIYRDTLKIKSNLQFDYETQQRRNQYLDNYHRIQDELKNKDIFINVRTNLENDNILASIDLETQNFSSMQFYGLDFSLENSNFSQYFGLYDENNSKIADFKYSQENKEFKAENFEKILTTQREVIKNPTEGEIDSIQLLPTNFRFYIISNLPVDNLNLTDVDFRIKNYVTETKANLKIKYFDESMFKYFDKINASIYQFLADYPNFKFNNSSSIILNPGTYNFTQTVIIPKDLTLIILPGTKIYLDPEISLISYGKILAQGSAENPIIFTASNKNKPWGVIAVVNQKENESIFNYCEFEYGNQDVVNGIYFTGQLAIHDSQAKITNSKFSNAQADDSLNIKYGLESIVENNQFINNSSDAIDFDWTNGKIQNNTFANNLGDAIDISGSQTLIQDNIIQNSGDKGISIGEKSEPMIVNNLILKNKIGIEVKDLSRALIINNTLTENEIGINEYMKKQIFGPAYAEVYNTIIWNNNQQITFLNNPEFNNSGINNSEIKVENSLVQGEYKGKKVIDINPNFDDNYKINPEYSGEVNEILNIDILKENNLKEYQNLGFNF